MTARTARTMGLRVVTDLSGDELIPIDGGERWVTARDLRAYVGGDVAVPAFRLEAGARAQRVSDLPNAEGPMGAGDLVTGLQHARNVNFSRAQLLAPLVELVQDIIDERIMAVLGELGYEKKAGDEK